MKELTYLQPSDFDKLNLIHIAGTKGKGSTAAFISSILTKFIGTSPTHEESKPLSKIGLYTSPHLRFVRERIQINGEPLSEEQFTKYFFEVWDKLERAAQKEGLDPHDPLIKPVYFRFLTFMAFHAYLSEKVDVAIIECGIGGRFDTTNVINRPVVTGITSLGIDHVGMLGSTLPEIAWHKAGIIKAGSKCYTTSSQLPEARVVLDRVASEAGSEVVYVDVDPRFASGQVKLGLEADFQKINASLALAIADEILRLKGFEKDSVYEAKVIEGLEDTRWPGRCETRREQNLTWYIDGGHTLESIKLAGQWYATTQQKLQVNPHKSTVSSSKPKRYLIFNQQTRDARALSHALHDTLATSLDDRHPFTHAIFCTNATFKEAGFKPDLISMNTNALDFASLKVQNELAEAWALIDKQAEVSVVQTIEEAVEVVRDAARTSSEEVAALVTGSLHLVGGFLEVIEAKPDESQVN